MNKVKQYIYLSGTGLLVQIPKTSHKKQITTNYNKWDKNVILNYWHAASDTCTVAM